MLNLTDFIALGPYAILILLSILVILSYIFDLVSRWSHVPSVLMLLAVGMGLRYLVTSLGLYIPNLRIYLEILGTIGLILIVLEATLELKLDRKRLPTIRKSLSSALLVLLASSLLIARLIQIWSGAPFQTALVNAIPLAVISSATAIPSVWHLGSDKKEFCVYEATFSDILGIMLFNFSLQSDIFSADSMVKFVTGLAAVLFISGLCSLLLLFFMDRLKTHIKFFLILSLLVLVYSGGKLFHLSSLLLILVFGLTITNMELFIRGRLQTLLNAENLSDEILNFKTFTAESAFLIRTFFFILFGFSINLESLASREILILSSLIVSLVFAVRFFYLKFLARISLLPELFVAPRGLITLLLYYSIPPAFIISTFSEGILFYVIIITSIIMMLGLLITRSSSRGQDKPCIY